MSMALGPVGNKNVSVGPAGTSVPVSAFANLLSTLGARAFGQAEAAAEPSEALPGYLYNEGTLAVDPAVPEQRAARLLELLGEAEESEALAVPGRISMLTEADEYYDAVDIADLDSVDLEGNDLELDD
jgi:hypothetical protein